MAYRRKKNESLLIQNQSLPFKKSLKKYLSPSLLNTTQLEVPAQRKMELLRRALDTKILDLE